MNTVKSLQDLSLSDGAVSITIMAGREADIMSKQEVLSAIQELPDDVSFEDVMYHLYFMNNIRQGLKDVEEGRTFTHEQVKAMFAR